MSSTNEAVAGEVAGVLDAADRAADPAPADRGGLGVGRRHAPVAAHAPSLSAIGVDRLGERAADEHGGELLAVLGAAVHVGGRVDRRAAARPASANASPPRRGAVEHLLGRLDAQRDLVDAADDDPRRRG